ncbi:hypothetical protein [Psychrobacter phenylpyruvicus]|uniref:Lipoprotein n=1 Tax=Psychrobacter phenylpyruvicus TaxID=29432 RepID=A0A379LK34_9GAMM|nr:hypothetical protein [Psychrobacter phenylpyruvicus]SUD90908.1 Uncharacterised protein [Psychrobacter phenylpyruvicus]
MEKNYRNIIAATVGLALLSGCAPSQDGKYRLGDVVNDVTRAILVPAPQTTANTQANAIEVGGYIRPMLEGCDLVDIERLVQEQKGVIADVQRVSEPRGDDPNATTTVRLKNAVVFGHPLQKIETHRGYNDFSSKLYFGNDAFVKLRSAFKVPTGDDANVTKNDASGYLVKGYEYVSLDFDRQNRTVTCGKSI